MHLRLTDVVSGQWSTGRLDSERVLSRGLTRHRVLPLVPKPQFGCGHERLRPQEPAGPRRTRHMEWNRADLSTQPGSQPSQAQLTCSHRS